MGHPSEPSHRGSTLLFVSVQRCRDVVAMLRAQAQSSPIVVYVVWPPGLTDRLCGVVEHAESISGI